MTLYLDTADTKEIEAFSSIIDGVTTTPTIIKRDGATSEEFMSTVREKYPHLDVHLGALGKTAKDTEMVIEEFRKKSWYQEDKVVFKVPVSKDGLEATRALKRKYPGVRINLHMVFSSAQATLAMYVGADFVSPLIGRYSAHVASLHKYGNRSSQYEAGRDMLSNIMACKRAAGSKSVILASSIRTVHDFAMAAELCGADAITTPPHILRQALEHPLTTHGVNQFWKDLT